VKKRRMMGSKSLLSESMGPLIVGQASTGVATPLGSAPMAESTLIEHLRRLPLFAQLEERELVTLAQHVRVRAFKRADTICTFCGDGCQMTVQTKDQDLIEVNSAQSSGRNNGDHAGPNRRRGRCVAIIPLPRQPKEAASEQENDPSAKGDVGHDQPEAHFR